MVVVEGEDKLAPKQYWWRVEAEERGKCAPRPRPDSLCPHCQQGKLAYDSLFNLSCPVCGRVAAAGAFT
ncbi:MAG: hypothetical protein IPL78_30630 [Chloroflexi bacterium]|nr:hypothetical protein [Chloroflexota bacterium]